MSTKDETKSRRTKKSRLPRKEKRIHEYCMECDGVKTFVFICEDELDEVYCDKEGHEFRISIREGSI